MIEQKWKERMTYIVVEVTTKDGYETNDSGIPPRSGVTNVDASYKVFKAVRRGEAMGSHSVT